MKCAIVIADGVLQVNLTPENAHEKRAVQTLGSGESLKVSRHKGTFGPDSYPEFEGYDFGKCRGGYMRAWDNSNESLLLTVEHGENDASR